MGDLGEDEGGETGGLGAGGGAVFSEDGGSICDAGAEGLRVSGFLEELRECKYPY